MTDTDFRELQDSRTSSGTDRRGQTHGSDDQNERPRGNAGARYTGWTGHGDRPVTPSGDDGENDSHLGHAIIRKENADGTELYFRLEEDELVERAVHPDGRVGDVYPVAREIDFSSEAYEVVSPAAWPERDDERARALVADGGYTDPELEWALDRIRARTSPDPDGEQDAKSNIWTGLRHIKQDGSESERVRREDVNGLVEVLIESGAVITWHGLLAPADDDHLRAIIENERKSGEPRKLLVARVNRRLGAGQQLATDGGRTISPGGPIDPLVCPRGHHSVQISAHRVRCLTCENQGRDPNFDRDDLVDLRREDPPLAETSEHETEVERRRREHVADSGGSA